MTRACDRTWEVEAVRDGRLRGGACESLQRHLERCEACRRERDALDGLAARLVQHHRERPVDEVALRRSKLATLRRADAAWRNASHGALQPSRPLVSALAVCVAAAVIIMPTSNVPRARLPVSVNVTADAGAEWRERMDAGCKRIELARGTLALSVRGRHEGPSVVLVVPDGQIEDVGTVFQVSVEGGVTTQISVLEGAVVFRRRGAAPLWLSAPVTWAPERSVPSPTAPSLQRQDSEVLAPSVTASSAERAPQRSTQRLLPRKIPGPDVASAASSHDPQAPSSAQAFEEDVLYLRIMHSLRENRKDEARSEARRYLSTFPNGFRRVEVERLAR